MTRLTSFQFRNKKRILIFSFLVFFLTCNLFSVSPDYYSPESVYKFAEWLFEEGDYLRAIGEYKRYIFLSDGEGKADIVYKIGICYKLSGDYENAIKLFIRIIDTSNTISFSHDIFFDLSNSYFMLGMYEESLKTSTLYSELYHHTDERIVLINAAAYLCLREWYSAYDILIQTPAREFGVYHDMYIALVDISKEYNKGIYKNGFAAGLLSTLIPGLGKMYTGDVYDGLFSFCVIGLLGGMAAWSFYEEGKLSVKGWIYSSIGGIFYLGNIYGSVVSAQKYNQKQDTDIIEKVRELFEHYLQ